jgi:hypothetical protein
MILGKKESNFLVVLCEINLQVLYLPPGDEVSPDHGTSEHSGNKEEVSE